MKISAEHIVAALEDERTTAQRGLHFKTVSSRRSGDLVIFAVEPVREARASSALDDSLEGSRGVWSAEASGRGEVVVVDPERGELSLRFIQGTLPEAGQRVTLYQQDFLTPLIELWQRPDARGLFGSFLKRAHAEPVAPRRPLPVGFARLRRRQAEAISLPLDRLGLMFGPPGTGKTFTIGATIAYLLSRFRNSRILVTGPTNTAVDSALIAADDWLGRIGRDDLRRSMKRVGSRLDAGKFSDRGHLLAEGLHRAAVEVTMLELEEPARNNIERYVAWKERLEAARAKLNTDVAGTAASCRVLAITTSSLFRHFDGVASRAGGAWHFAIADEAGRVSEVVEIGRRRNLRVN